MRTIKYRSIFYSLFLSSLLIFSFYGDASYPWKRPNQTGSKNFFELDFSTSYFFKSSKYASFPYLRWSYHNPTVDIDIAYRRSSIEKKHYFSLNELALTFPFFSSSYTTFTLGSRNQDWSEADKYWNLGLWQPRHIVDPFRPSQMGLPGLYVDWAGPVFMTFFASYFSLPDIIIYPDLVDGKIQSKNPFFIDPIVTDQVGVTTKWDLDHFQAFDWASFLKPAAGFQLKHQLPHSELSVSYAYKTINQLQYSVLLKKIALSTLSKDNKSIVIKDLRYDIGYHHLATVEVKVMPVDAMTFFVSLFYEKPKSKKSRKDWIQEDFESHLTTSFYTRFRTESSFDQKIFTFGYIKVFESKLRDDKSNLITEDIELLFGRSFDWNEAASFSMEYYTKKILSGYNFNLRMNYALDSKFYLVNFENDFYFTPYFRTYFSGDVLFRLNNSDSVSQARVSIARYENLSRLIFGVRYVF